MEVKIIFVKLSGTERTEIPYEKMGPEEKEAQGAALKTRFYGALGYTPVEKTA